MRILFIVSIAYLFFACSTASNPQNNTCIEKQNSLISFDQTEQIQIGNSTKDSIQKIFGSPDLSIPQDKVRDEEKWLYFEGCKWSIPRLSVGFEPTTGIVQSISWGIRPGDPENDLSKAKARFPKAKFFAKNAEWTHPDAASDEIFYSDEKLGITIVYNSTPNRVETIILRGNKRSISTETKAH